MIKYNSKKLTNQDLVKFITGHVGQKGLDRIDNCGNFLEFIENGKIDKELKRKLLFSMSCNNRFCPLCSWRKAKKDAMIIAVLMKYINAQHGKEFIMLTLTVPNVDGDELRDKIKEMNYASKKMFLQARVNKVNKGYLRKLEVTFNQTTVNEQYHPHFHVLIAVNKSYFTSRDYIKQSEWLDIWRKEMKDDTITQVDVRRVTIKDSMNEIAKYTAKSADYLFSKDVFDVFYKALKGAQVLTYNKLFKDAMGLYKADKLDAYKVTDPTVYTDYVVNKWNRQRHIDTNGEIWEPNQYIELDRRPLTQAEQNKYNFTTVGEADDDLKDD